MNRKNELVAYVENLSLFIVCLTLTLFPLLFLSTTTDAFVLPKQLLLIFATGAVIVLLGLRTIAEGRLRLKASPFDLPVALLTLVFFLSAVFSVNRFDALTNFAPVFFASLLYFVIVSITKEQKRLLFILCSLTLGAVLAAAVSLLSFFKIYPLPFTYTHVTYFTTFGSLLDQAVYLAVVLPISGYFSYMLFASMKPDRESAPSFFSQPHGHNTAKVHGNYFLFALSFVVILADLGVTLYMLATTQKPLLLPFATGLQTAFASISQDTLNVFKSFLLGSGIGTYMTDFTRFKTITFNLSNDLWSFTFFRSSSFVLELLATTGLLGVASFAFLIFKVIKEKEFFLPVVVILLASLILPFSFTLIALLFVVLAILAVVRIHANPQKYGEMDLYLVALKRGLFVTSAEGEKPQQSNVEKRVGKILPLLSTLFLFVIVLVPLYFVVRFTMSDVLFQKSLVAASQNNGLETYNMQVAAINTFPYRDVYYRSFSQTNLALANALATSQQSGSPSAQIQQNILTLIQQSINAGRNATTISPLTSFNWNNLSTIYRSLIGFGQNADRFSVLTLQQAIALDQNNPQQYVDLGGIYYQLGQYDEAIRQFQIAINLKQDYPNAYYNLAHALEQKGDLQNAMQAYQAVRQLVANNPENVKRVDADIKALQDKANTKAEAPKKDVKPQEDKTPLDVNKPATSLPERDPKVKIPAPTVSPIPSKTEENKPTPAL